MIISTVQYLREILEAVTPQAKLLAEQRAVDAIRAVVPVWQAGDNEQEDGLHCVHPDDGQTYVVELQDCNLSNSVSAYLGDDSGLELRLDDLSVDASDCYLIAVFRDCPASQCVFFVSDEFRFDWAS